MLRAKMMPCHHHVCFYEADPKVLTNHF